jgi:3-isopropylmalate/(R)-2-methylmalate dehydratase small subunit
MVPVQLDEAHHARLVQAGVGEVGVDLVSLLVTLPDGTKSPFALEPFSRHCLMEGVDELAYLIAQEADIAAYERRKTDLPQGANP